MIVKIGEIFKAYREKKGLTQKEVSKKSGIKENYISRFENGEFDNPTLATLEALSKAMGVTWHYVVESYGVKIPVNEDEARESAESFEELSEKEYDVIEKYAQLTSDQQYVVDCLMDCLLNKSRRKAKRGRG